jgi:hypothetical protein
MACRLNLLFATAPQQFMERTVLFTDELTSPGAVALMRDRIAHHFDLQPANNRATAQVLAGQHLYRDTPLAGYFLPPRGSTVIPKDDSPYRFVFLPEFTCCRLMVRPEGDDWLRLELEQGLMSPVPPIEAELGSRYIDSFSYWDYTSGHLVGKIRATAVLLKEQGLPWTILMQQIVGTPGFEQARMLTTRALRY